MTYGTSYDVYIYVQRDKIYSKLVYVGLAQARLIVPSPFTSL